MPNLSVILRTYTEARWDSLLAAVRSVREQSCPPDEIVVVVDHNPALYARVRAALPGVVAVENREPAGSSGAWNSGILAATGDILAFMDDDATAAPDWLEQLRLGYRDPQVLGVGGEIVPVWVDGRPAWFPDEFAWVVGCTYRGLSETESNVRNLIGCNMSFRREVFAAAGGFRGAQNGIGHMGAAPIGCDETEFCIRVRRQWPDKFMRYRPQARVYHRVPAGRANWRYFRTRCYFEGRSKARVAQLVGPQDGLESERAYTLRTLPRGVLQGIGDFALRRDAAGLGRATAIVAGLACTAAGYLAGALTARPTPRPQDATAPHGVTGEQRA